MGGEVRADGTPAVLLSVSGLTRLVSEKVLEILPTLLPATDEVRDSDTSDAYDAPLPWRGLAVVLAGLSTKPTRLLLPSCLLPLAPAAALAETAMSDCCAVEEWSPSRSSMLSGLSSSLAHEMALMGLKLMGSLSIMLVVSYGSRGVSSTWWNNRGPNPNVPVPEPLSESKAPHLFSPFLASMASGSADGTAVSVGTSVASAAVEARPSAAVAVEVIVRPPPPPLPPPRPTSAPPPRPAEA